MEVGNISADAVIRRVLAGCSRDWWQRYRFPAWLMILAVWLHVVVLAIAMVWNALEAFGYAGYSGGT